MRRAVLSTFLFVAILGLGCMGVVTPSKADEHCEDTNDPQYDPSECEGTSSGDFQKGMNAYERGDFTTALRKWKPLAEEGNARAQYWLGSMYKNGRGVPQDDKTALKWYRLSAEQGHALAQNNLELLQKKMNPWWKFW